MRGTIATGVLRYIERSLSEQGGSIMTATLCDSCYAYIIPCLDQARVVRSEPHGVLLTGIEIIPLKRGAKNHSYDCFRQTWWCVPAAEAPQ